MTIVSRNPVTGQVLRSFAETSAAEVEAKIASAAVTFADYRLTSFEQRAGWRASRRAASRRCSSARAPSTPC